MEWVKEDMRRFRRPGAFQLVVSLFTSFGYFDDADDNMGVLRNAHECLIPGGCLVVDVLGKEIIARRYEPTASEEIAGAGTAIQLRHVVDDWSRMENRWMLVREDAVQSFVITHWIYSGVELREMLRAAGFREVRLHGDWNGAPYGVDAERLIAVARKSG